MSVTPPTFVVLPAVKTTKEVTIANARPDISMMLPTRNATISMNAVVAVTRAQRMLNARITTGRIHVLVTLGIPEMGKHAQISTNAQFQVAARTIAIALIALAHFLVNAMTATKRIRMTRLALTSMSAMFRIHVRALRRAQITQARMNAIAMRDILATGLFALILMNALIIPPAEPMKLASILLGPTNVTVLLDLRK